MVIITDPACANYSAPGHPERPMRVTKSVERLKAQTEIPLTWRAPLAVSDAILLRAHSEEHLKKLKQSGDFDPDTPAYPDIAEHARRSAGAALGGLAACREGQIALSLIRPPGHHATRDRAMGFCYLNSVAIACLEALASGSERIAVYDFDVHHGNGTEAILIREPRARFCSTHQHPCYPGTGLKNAGTNCFNFPVPPRTPRLEYRKVLGRALEEAAAFKPDLLAVSAGFDAYARDPLAQETLELEDFHWVGKSIRELGLPVFSVLEGGYSSDLPELILAYLRGLGGG